MKLPVLLVLSGLLFAATAQADNATELSQQLRRHMPVTEFAIISQSEFWHIFREEPMTGFVVMRGTVGGNERVTITEVVESLPDKSRNPVARVLAGQARVNSVGTGSLVRPRVNVYVLFYDTGKQVHRALIFATQADTGFNVNQRGQNCFITVLEYHLEPKNKPGTPATTPKPAQTAARH